MNDKRHWLAAGGALWLLACGGEEITHVRLAKSANAPAAPAMAAGLMQPAETGAAADEGQRDGLAWTLPAGWTAKRETGMRYATLKPGGAADVEVSVVVLPGPVGGELANVNRWRGQIGLAPVGEEQLPALRKPMSSDAGPLKLFDLVSEGKKKSRTLAAMLAASDGNTWFVKMTGEDAAVKARQPEFLRLLSSLRFGEAGEGGKP